MPEDDFRYELLRGELIKMSPTGFDHGRVAAKLLAVLERFAREQALGVVVGTDAGFILSRDPDTVRAPDIAFVSQQRLREAGHVKAFWPGAPDLAIEVLSPDDRTFEIEEKVQEYLTAGARMVWVVSPKLRTVTIYRSGGQMGMLGSEQILDGGDVLPGFRLIVGEIFD